MFEIKFTIDLTDRALQVIEQLTQALSVVAPKVEAPKVDNGGTLKIEELRALLRVKVNNDENRGKLKAKLESLGASNVTTLAKEHYTEFYNFMNTLP